MPTPEVTVIQEPVKKDNNIWKVALKMNQEEVNTQDIVPPTKQESSSNIDTESDKLQAPKAQPIKKGSKRLLKVQTE